MPTRTGDGIYCRGASSGSHVQTGIDIDSLGGTPNVLLLTLAYYDASGDGNEITTIRYGDGTNWQNFVVGSKVLQGALYPSVAAIYAIENPDTSYDRIEIITSEAISEGISVTWAAYSDVDYANIQFYAEHDEGSLSLTNTFTGGSTGDELYIGGHDYSGGGDPFTLTNQSQSLIASEGTTACNSQHYGHARKDWSSGATVEMAGNYPYIGAAHLPAAAGGATALPFRMRY